MHCARGLLFLHVGWPLFMSCSLLCWQWSSFLAEKRQASLYSLMVLMNLLQSWVYWKWKHDIRHWGFIGWEFGDFLLYRSPLLVYINNFISQKKDITKLNFPDISNSWGEKKLEDHSFVSRLQTPTDASVFVLFHTVSNGYCEILANTWAKTII